MSDHVTTADATSSDEVEDIKRGIEATQATLACTVAELQRRLTLSHLIEQVKGSLAERFREFACSSQQAMSSARVSVEQTTWRARTRLRENPAPLALIAAGLAAALWQGVRRR